ARDRAAIVQALRDAAGDAYFTDGALPLEQVIGEALRERGATIATAESCTGGLVAARLTAVAGASEYVLGGVVAYANAAKSDLLGVPPTTIETAGAVSEEVARAMARGARARFDATYGI